MTEVLVDFNDEVSRGQVIARIDPSTFQAQISQGNAQIEGARASLVQAQATLRSAQLAQERKAGLGERQLVARSDVDQALVARDLAAGAVRAAQAQIQQQAASTRTTRINLDRTVIRSPVDGVVLTRTLEPGQTVAASLQAPELFTMAEDLGQMKIELAVDEADIGQVKVGQAVNFTADAFADRRFQGIVQQVRLSATNQQRGDLSGGVGGQQRWHAAARADRECGDRGQPARRCAQGLQRRASLQAHRRGRRGNGVGGGLAAGWWHHCGPVPDRRGAGALDARQQAAFDAAVAVIEARQAARQAAPAEANRVFGGRRQPQRSAGGGGNVTAQMRQRILQRYKQDFSAFSATLDDTQSVRWDAAVAALIGARRAPLFQLVDGKPHQVLVRIGASDGTSTEVSGAIEAGDVIVTGERAAQ